MDTPPPIKDPERELPSHPHQLNNEQGPDETIETGGSDLD